MMGGRPAQEINRRVCEEVWLQFNIVNNFTTGVSGYFCHWFLASMWFLVLSSFLHWREIERSLSVHSSYFRSMGREVKKARKMSEWRVRCQKEITREVSLSLRDFLFWENCEQAKYFNGTASSSIDGFWRLFYLGKYQTKTKKKNPDIPEPLDWFPAAWA